MDREEVPPLLSGEETSREDVPSWRTARVFPGAVDGWIQSRYRVDALRRGTDHGKSFARLVACPSKEGCGASGTRNP
jgi:hypothetical protein